MGTACPNTTISSCPRLSCTTTKQSPAIMSLEPGHRRSGSSNIAGVCAALARLSIDLNGGGAIRPGTLLDEYERLAIEAQLSQAVLRRSYSEPSPSRVATLSDNTGPAVTGHRGENVEKGEVPARRFILLEALKRVWCWLSSASAWGGHGRNGEQPVPQPPPPAPAVTRVCLLDYLR